VVRPGGEQGCVAQEGDPIAHQTRLPAAQVSKRLLAVVGRPGVVLSGATLLRAPAAADAASPGSTTSCLLCPCSSPRFNLLREESEGYAKLATLLNQQAAGAVSAGATDAVVRSCCCGCLLCCLLCSV
jgi:hypothetical protein